MITVIREDRRYNQKFSSNFIEGKGLFSSSATYDPENQHFGEIFSFGDYCCSPGYGVPMHPHELFEVVCIQLSGKMHFVDMLGNDRVTEEGSVHHFSASTGYSHSVSVVGDNPMRYLSIWIAPKRESLVPSYQQKSFGKSAFPLDSMRMLFTDVDRPVSGVLPIVSNVRIYAGSADTKTFECYMEDKTIGLLYVTEGTLIVNDINLNSCDHIRVANEKKLDIKGTPGARFVFVLMPDQ